MRDAILKRQRAPRTRKIDVPEWSAIGEVFVRMLGADERDAWDAMRIDAQGASDIRKLRRSRFVALVVSDALGNRIFRDEDAAALGEEPSDVIQAIFEAGLDFNAMRAEDDETAKKNSKPDHDG